MHENTANDDNDGPLSPSEKATIRQNIFNKIQLPATSESRQFFPGGKYSWLPRIVAAAVLIVIIIPTYLFIRPAPAASESLAAATTGFKAGPGQVKRLILPDSTIVILNANSEIQLGSDFSGSHVREVKVQGNAFFSVKKDKHSPFVIHAGGLAVTVLGTDLNVNARSAQAEVTLATGKVKVEREGYREGPLYLQPGEKATLDLRQNHVLRSFVNPSLYSAWIKNEWNFRQTTLEEITDLISEYYGVSIVFRDDRARSLRINAVIPVRSLENLISVIERTLQLDMQVKNNQLIVQ